MRIFLWEARPGVNSEGFGLIWNAIKILNFIILLFSLTSRICLASDAKWDTKKYDGWGYYSQAELAALPEYCIARFSKYGKDLTLHDKWKKIVGGDFEHFHHF